MISTDFAPNESWDDARVSLKLLFQPWRWKKGVETQKVKKTLKQLTINNQQPTISLFLSGRSALYFLLKSLQLPVGSEVVIQAFTCEAVVLPIIANNLKPIYIDIESDTYSMNYRELTNRLTDNCGVLILQHTFGLTPEYREEILRLAKEKKLIVIEDLAHGFSKQLAINNQQSFFLLSFGRSKLLSSVFGGAIISPNNQQLTINNLESPSSRFIFLCLLYKPLTMLIKSTYDLYIGKILHRLLNSFNLLIPEITPSEKAGEYDELFNKAYPNALAILLLHQLKKFEQIQKNRAKICRFYEHSIAKSNQQLTINNSSMVRFPLLVNNQDEIIKKARDRKFFLGTWYDQVVAPKGLNLDRVEYKQGSCPQAEVICKKILNLPTNISENEAKRVVGTLDDVI